MAGVVDVGPVCWAPAGRRSVLLVPAGGSVRVSVRGGQAGSSLRVRVRGRSARMRRIPFGMQIAMVVMVRRFVFRVRGHVTSR